MIPRRVSVAVALFGFVLAVSLAATGGPSFVRARQDLPTPKGQLGGPMPLPTGSARASGDATATPSEPAACDHAPVSIDELLAAAAANPAPLPDIDWAVAPDADAAQTEAASVVVADLVACANRNDPARTLALYSADGLARSLERQGITPQTVELAVGGAGGPLPETAQARLVSLDRVLAADDRLRAEFTLLERSGIGELRLRLYVVELVSRGDAWLVDDVLPAPE